MGLFTRAGEWFLFCRSWQELQFCRCCATFECLNWGQKWRYRTSLFRRIVCSPWWVRSLCTEKCRYRSRHASVGGLVYWPSVYWWASGEDHSRCLKSPWSSIELPQVDEFLWYLEDNQWYSTLAPCDLVSGQSPWECNLDRIYRDQLLRRAATLVKN